MVASLRWQICSCKARRGSSWMATRKTGRCQIIWNWGGIRWVGGFAELGAAGQQVILQHKLKEGVMLKGGTKSHQNHGALPS